MVPEVDGISYSSPTLQGYEHFLSNILQMLCTAYRHLIVLRTLWTHTHAITAIVTMHRPAVAKILVLVLILGLLGLFLLYLGLPLEFYDLKNAELRKHKSSPSGQGGPDLSTFQSIVGTSNRDYLPAHSNFGSRISLSSTFETIIPHNATIHGFNVFDNLIMHNGTFYLVTNNRNGFPEKANIARLRERPGAWGEHDPHEDVRAFLQYSS